MAWAIVNSGAAHAKNGTADGSVGPYVAPHTGTIDTTGADLYVVACSHYDGSQQANTTLDDVAHNSYTLLADITASGDGSCRVAWYYKVAPTTSNVEKWTVTAAGGRPTNAGVCGIAFSGCAASPTIAHAEIGTTTSNPKAGTAIGSSGDLMVSAVANYAVDSSSIDSSFAIVEHEAYTASNNIGLAIAWCNNSAGLSGSTDPTWTMTSAPTAVCIQNVTFTGTGGGGGGRGLFMTPPTTGIGIGGSFFRDPLQARAQMVRRDRIFVPERYAA